MHTDEDWCGLFPVSELNAIYVYCCYRVLSPFRQVGMNPSHMSHAMRIILCSPSNHLRPLRAIQGRRVFDISNPVVQLCLPAVRHDGAEFRVHEQTRREGVDFVLLHAFEESVPVDALVLDRAVAAWEDAFVEPVHGEGGFVGFAHGLFDEHLQAVHCVGELGQRTWVR